VNGKIGSLHVGRLQFGGIIDWTLDLILSDYSNSQYTQYKLAKWKLTAQGYWLFDVPTKVTVRLYPDSGKGYWEGIGVVTSTPKPIFDTLLHEPIELIGEHPLEGKE
jgi:hypothetical protein